MSGRAGAREEADMSQTETVICIYRVRPGREDEFQRLLARHWPTLRELGLASDAAPRHFRGAEQSGRPLFVEIFEWADAGVAGTAHEHPQVMAIWEPMDALTERRDGRPNMEFPHVQPLDVLGTA
jgi:hypothetical protein